MASILIVDDEPENLELLEGILAPTGHLIRKAEGGREALQAVEEELPELILLDLMMPRVSGFEVCEMLRSHQRTARIPIIIVTGFDQFGTKERVLAIGADDYLTKPINPGDVQARVDAMLKVRHLRQDLDRTLAYLHELEIASYTHRRRVLAKMIVGPMPSVQETGGGATPTILLMDDEEIARQFYGDLLVQHGFRVVAAAGGQEALEAALRHPLDAGLLDLMMPDVSGLNVLEELRRLVPDLPIIIITAYPSPQAAITAFKLGAFDFIVKGLQQDLVVLAVRRAIHHASELREKRQTIAALEARIRELEARLGP
jgi:DNA-binding response OmpR family regulator